MPGMRMRVAMLVCVVLVAGGCRVIGPGYKGRVGHRLVATGWFHTQQIDGQWWLATPDGQPFYSTGVNHVTADYDTDRVTGRCPYCDAIAARYSTPQAWSDATVARLRAWGFNTIGAWSDIDRFSGRIPYTGLLSMAAGNDWFSRDFVTHAEQQATTKVLPHRDDPNLVGWFLDNELSWGKGYASSTTKLDDYLALPVGSPGRIVAERYAGNPDGFLTALANRYYSVTTEAVRRVDPHHLIMGTRLISFLTPEQVVTTAGRFLDVLSVNHYDVSPGLPEALNGVWGPFVPVDSALTHFHALSGLPVLVTEYSFRGADSGLPNSWPPIYLTAPTQSGRADLWENKVRRLYAAPWIVGDHWFEWADEPPGGRFDGEDDNFGLVSNSDDPYVAFVARMTAVHRLAPDSLADPHPSCRAWKRTTGPRVSCAVR